MKHLLLLLNIVLLLLTIAVAIVATYLSWCRNRAQKRLVQRHADALREGRWFRIRYASPAYYQRWLKIFPWHDSGILHVTAQTIRLYLENDEVVAIPVAHCRAQWHGLKFFPNGLVHWFSLQHAGATHYLTSETGATILHSRSSSSDIFTQTCDYLGKALTVDAPSSPSPAFAIETNPHALGCVVLFFVLLLYFLLDNFFVLQEEYITWPAKILFVVGGLVTLIGAFLFMERGKVPVLEKTAIALLLCAVSIAALYPGLRRINQLIDSEGLQPYTYTFSATHLLIPQDPTLPRLPISIDHHNHDYWAQFNTGDSYEVQIRDGRLGFYQINMAPIYARMRDYYQQQYKLKQQARDTLAPNVIPKSDTSAPTLDITKD
jgi:hypothetical protein